MEINERTCPAIKYIKWKGQLQNHPDFKRGGRKTKPFLLLPFNGRVVTNDDSEFSHIFVNVITNWQQLAEKFRSDVWITTKSYRQGFESSAESIARNRSELYNRLKGEELSGTLIEAENGLATTILYSLRIDRSEEKPLPDGRQGTDVHWNGHIIILDGGEAIAWAAYGDLEGDGKRELRYGALPALKEYFLKNNASIDAGILFCVIDQIIFRRYAKVVSRETLGKPSGKNTEEKKTEDTLLVKAPFLEVNRYDVNWYTETVRTAGFPRKGYMAVRWKGPRGSQKPEIVPVRPTWCKGYTRKARKNPGDVECNPSANK